MNQEIEELYLKSIKELRRMLNQDRNLTPKKWNAYASKSCLLSSVTIMARNNVRTWEGLKRKYITVKKDRKRNIFLEIKKTRRKLDRNIVEKGLQDKDTRMYSDQMDILINEYYKSKEIREYPVISNMLTYYKKSYEELKKVTKEFNEFPNTKAWNKYALEHNCLSSTAMQYISMLDWNKLRDKIKAEINAKI